MVKASEKEVAIVRAALEKGSFSAESIADVVSELANFKTVNIAEWPEDLSSCILGLADEEGFIQGRARKFDAKRMAVKAMEYIKDTTGTVPPRVITREYNLRQQAMYIKFYTQNGTVQRD